MSRTELRAGSRLIHGHIEEPVADTLARVADWCKAEGVLFDAYGTGELIQRFEAEIAELLGYAAARFMPSGTLAQQIALRVWAEESGTKHVAMHPTAHLEVHENHGYSHLHGLEATLVGPRDQPMVAEHISAAADPLAALLVELPTREAGALLPSWGQLEGIKAVARRRGFKLHLDGARLWECGPAYDKSYAEICDGFDSTYVSFYKGIGALPGSMLLGSESFIAQAVVWQRRGGGNLYTLTPNVASAAMQFDERLARMPVLLDRARRLAETLGALDGVSVHPDPPHVNMFRVFLDLDVDTALEARDRVADQLRLWTFGQVTAADEPNRCWAEIYVGEAAAEVSDADVADAFRSLMTEA